MDQKESNVANTTEQFFVYVDRGRSRPIKNTVRSTASQIFFERASLWDPWFE